MDRIIRVGIIGQGRSGRDIHGGCLRGDPRYRIVAVCDAIKDRRDRAIREFGCESHKSHHELLKRDDLDLIVNASFSHQHVPITLDALRAGHNVLCEKPLASRVRDVDHLIATAKKARKLLAVFQQSRYAPYFKQVKSVIDSGALGRIVQISIAFNGFARRWDWQTLTEWNGGSLLNTGPHPLDQALVLFGAGKPKITCFMDRTRGTLGDAENHVKLLLSGKDRPLIDLEISSCCAYPSFTYHVYGELGGLKATNSEAQWRFFKWNESPRQKLTRKPLSKPDGTPSYPQETLTWHTGAWPDAQPAAPASAGYSSASAATLELTRRYYDMLYRSLTEGRPLEITVEQVRRQVAVIEECHRQNPHIHGQRSKRTR